MSLAKLIECAQNIDEDLCENSVIVLKPIDFRTKMVQR